MKPIINSKRLLMVGVMCASLFTGCKKDDFLEVPNTGTVTSETAFKTEASATLVLNDVYSNLPDLNNFIFEPFDSWTDDLMTGFNWNISSQVARNKTTINSNTVLYYDWSPATMWLDWTTLYKRVRKCNIFIQGVEASTLTQAFKDRSIAEARVLRAFFYHQLWMLYGGVPIITKPDSRETDGEAIFHPRASFDETFQFLQKELGEAAAAMPDNSGNSGKGKITKGAALTIKGWVELFYASKRNNPTNDLARWATAAATCKQVMQLGYGLYPKYDELFLTTGNDNNEGILYREYLTIKQGSTIVGFQGPNYVGTQWLSWGGSTPTQELVDDYVMANGKGINEPGSGYDAANPYANREPRFRQSILFNGNTFNGIPFLSAVGSGNNAIDLADATDNTNTGYCTKKRMDTTINIFQNAASAQNYYFFRYAEVLLNYAEAQNEAVGPDPSVYDALDQIRVRAGIPTFTAVYPGVTKDQMRELIRRERRVELAFEGKRYFDLIRWQIAETNLNKVMHGMKIESSGGGYTYTRINAVPAGAPQWTFDKNKNYLLPIPLNAIGRNPALKGHQNPGYQ
ncbi:MAG: RagB/SusD family nutrient uptake outer membrane protein [Chitinophagaceae bacterium]|nr:RagB/SusD family nutrient uptake outer membrane protein [Chitinophagaceae bacterium]